MIKKTIAKLLFKFHGWKLVGKPIPIEAQRCVFVFAPHTSNWDWYLGTLCLMAWGVPMKVVIKDFWTKFPLSIAIKPLGGVGIDRSPNPDGTKKNQVEKLASVFEHNEEIAFVITPEGTRAPRNQWKTGFYYIAQHAKVPIVTLGANTTTKTIEFGPVFQPGETLDVVMTEMMEFYKGSVAIYPENFKLDERYI